MHVEREGPDQIEAETSPPEAVRPSVRWIALALLVAIMAAGAWLRLAHLGKLSMWSDEFPHAIAGRSLADEGRPLLPSGREYRRGLLQTVAVGTSIRAFGASDTAARIPSAALGIATILALWITVRRRFGDGVALAAAAVLAVMPLHVAHSRSARFYAAFTLAYSGAAFFGARALRTGAASDGVVAAVSLMVALHLQPLGALIVAPFAADAAVLFFTSEGDERRRRGRVLLLIATLAAVAAVAILAGIRDQVAGFLEAPVPGVELGPALRGATIGRTLGQVGPWIWIVLGPAILYGLRRTGRDGAAVCLHALLPALILSLLYRRVDGPSEALNARYLLHLMPALAVVVGLGMAELVRISRSRGGVALASSVALAAASVAGAPSVIGLPRAEHPGPVIPRPNWRAAAAIVRSDARPGDALLATHPLAMSWYVGRCGMWLRSAERASPYLEGERDVYCGTVVVSDIDAVRRIISTHARGWVVADAAWSQFVEPGVRRFIEGHMDRPPLADRSVMVYRWPASG